MRFNILKMFESENRKIFRHRTKNTITSDLSKHEDLHLEYQKRPTWRNATLKGQGTRCQIPCVYLNLELCPYGLTTTFFNTYFLIRRRIKLVRRPVGFELTRVQYNTIFVWRWSCRHKELCLLLLRIYILWPKSVVCM